MSKKKQYHGKDLNDALNVAAADLGITTDDIHYRFIDEGRKGILGMGARDVVIVVEPPLKQPAADSHNVLMKGETPVAGRERSRSRGSGRSRNRNGRQPQASGEGDGRESNRETREPSGEGRGGTGRSRNRRRRRRGGEKQGGENRGGRREGNRGGRRGSRSDDRRSRRGPSRSQEPVEVDEAQMEKMAGTLREMLGFLHHDMEVTCEVVRSGVRMELTGGDQEMLSKDEGEFLFSLQFLLNRMSRRAWPNVGRIQLVSEGHRSRRDEELVEEVKEVAGQVAHTGQPKSLQAMNPYERPLVHLTVREFEGLVSESEGEGFRKRVTISPARDDA